jgi:hypothetical protein
MNTEQIVQEEVEDFVINTEYVLVADPLRHAIRQAIMREREECAKVCDKEIEEWGWDADVVDVGRAIRARGNE